MSRTPRPPPGTRPPAAAATAAAAAAACVGAGRRQGVRGGRLVVASRPAAPVGRRNGRADVRACESVQMSAIRRCSGVSCVPVGCQRTSTRPAANERTTAARRETREARTYTLTAARAHARRPRPCPRRPTPCARIHDTSTSTFTSPSTTTSSFDTSTQAQAQALSRTPANSSRCTPFAHPGSASQGRRGHQARRRAALLAALAAPRPSVLMSGRTSLPGSDTSSTQPARASEVASARACTSA